MRVVIIAFSQTGNTWKLAEAIGGGIRRAGADCRLIPFERNKAVPEDCDLFGVGCPVFYYQEPLHVRHFLDSLPPLPGRDGFVFCSHGSIMGATLGSMAGRLARKGVRVIGAHDAYADAFLPFYPHPTYTSGHPDDEALAAAHGFGEQMVARRRALEAGAVLAQPVLEAIPEEWTKNAAMFTPEFMARVFPPLTIDFAACTGCLECERGCPVGGIAVSADPPRIQAPCIYCWHCVNICPEAAIEADWSGQVAIAPKLYRRYRYWLDVASAQGRFRWRVDPESIDFGAPYAQQRKLAIRRRRSPSG